MKISPVIQNHKNNFSFGAGLNPSHLEFIKNIAPKEIAYKLNTQNNIACHFGHNKLAAALVDKTTDICKKLNMRLPSRVSIYNFGIFKRSIVACTISDDLYGFIKNSTVELNEKYFKCSTNAYDKFCDKHAKKWGTPHILSVPIHEYIHVNHQKNLFNRQIHTLKKIKLSRFKNEIGDKIGTYAKKNPMELYATYWTKEICDSLDDAWLPKYNPFKEPKIKLSRELRLFLNAIEKGHTSIARKLAQGNIYSPKRLEELEKFLKKGY